MINQVLEFVKHQLTKEYVYVMMKPAQLQAMVDEIETLRSQNRVMQGTLRQIADFSADEGSVSFAEDTLAELVLHD